METINIRSILKIRKEALALRKRLGDKSVCGPDAAIYVSSYIDDINKCLSSLDKLTQVLLDTCLLAR